MQDLSTALIHFFQVYIPIWVVCYGVLAGVYLVAGYVVGRYNRARLSDYRIQQKNCPDELIKRDIKQSLKSLITIAGMLSAGITLSQLGFSLVALLGLESSAISWYGFIVWGVASLLLFDTWFYWAHRLIHHKRLYVHIHRWHHRSSTPTVWANNSDTFLDNLFCQSYWFFAPLILPIPTAILLVHKLYDQVTGMLGHAGHEYASGQFSAKPSPMIGTSFHDLHHSAFHYNFATHFSIWDRLMGTLHPDYDRMIMAFPNETTFAPDNSDQTSEIR